MTNTPGEGQTPQDPYSGQSGYGEAQNAPAQDQPGHDQPGYWEQQGSPSQQPGQSPYGQPPYGQGPGYPAQPAQPAPQYAPDHPKATTALVLGILGVVLCQVLGPFAWWMGKRTVREIDASNGMVGGRGAANAGYILGVIGTVLLALSVLAAILVLGLFVLTTLSSVN